MATLDEALNKVEEQREYIKKLENVLQGIYIDAEMALCDDWDRTDDGFQAQIEIIEEVFPEVQPYEREEI